jgi:sugar phosphate isomerase/epimerase
MRSGELPFKESSVSLDSRMPFSLSTHWNAARHSDGRAMIDEILELGVSDVELGYDLMLELVPGVRERVRERAVRVTSLHNFCPVPVGALRGHPELFLLAAADARERESAVANTRKTVEFAAEVGARAVVVHAGYVDVPVKTQELIALAERGELHSPEYDRLKMKLLMKRESRVGRCLDDLCRSLEALLPALETYKIVAAIELLPAWESVPSEQEMEVLSRRVPSPWVRFWYDAGHGRIRDNLGFVASLRWLEKLRPLLAGAHLHDVAPPASDHLMPPRGQMDFRKLAAALPPGIIRVVEPLPGTPAEHIREGLAIMEEAFSLPKEAAT